MFIVLWPIIILWGVAEYLLYLLKSPALLMSTYRVPDGIRSPGEKSLVGIHNAFLEVLDMPEPLYIRCVDEWVIVLFANKNKYGLSLSEYVNKERDRQTKASHDLDQFVGPFRNIISVARESLSRDLGHYFA